MENALLIDKTRFPICHLNDNIISMLHSLKSIDWLNITTGGLDKYIILGDFYGPITDIARLDLSNKIHLSLAYCQFLWSLCYVASRTYDCNNFQQEVEGLTPEEIEQFKKELEIGRNNEIVKELKNYIDPEDVFQKCHLVFESGASLINNSIKNQDFSLFYEIPSAIDEDNSKVNAIYCYAVIFILCHEIGHFSLQHPWNVTPKEENEADNFSFWTLYSDPSDVEKISAMIGALSALCSLMFFNKNLSGDKQHPNEDERIISALKVIQDEYPHYNGFVLQLFKMWGYYFEFSDFPDISSYSNNEEALNAILAFVERKRIDDI